MAETAKPSPQPPVAAVPQSTEMSKNVDEATKRREEMRTKREKEREEVLAKARQILEDYYGQESNIPLTSEYWDLMNRQRGLR